MKAFAAKRAGRDGFATVGHSGAVAISDFDPASSQTLVPGRQIRSGRPAIRAPARHAARSSRAQAAFSPPHSTRAPTEILRFLTRP